MEIQVSLDDLTFGDLEKLDDVSRKKTTPKELVELLDRIVVGDVRALPLTAMPDIIAALSTAMRELTEEADVPEGNE